MFLPRWIIVAPLPRFASGMALFPFILVKDASLKRDEILINHEKIHLQQQLETLIIPFYVVYFLNYFFNLWRYGSHEQAYLNLFFEREAYSCEQELAYLKRRPFWAFLRYIRKNDR